MNGGISRKVWLSGTAFLALTAIGAARIVSSSSAFFQTSDEGLHIACGVLWLNDAHVFACLDQPPLARIAAVLPLSWSGALRARVWKESRSESGFEVPGSEGVIELQNAFASDYERTLSLARLGILPFFLASSFLVWIWTRRWFGESAALAAVFLS